MRECAIWNILFLNDRLDCVRNSIKYEQKQIQMYIT